MTLRQRFERWARRNRGFDLKVTRGGAYDDYRARLAWHAYECAFKAGYRAGRR